MEPYRDDTDIAAALKALRAAPRPEFAAELDARAAAGFPPSAERGSSPLAHLASRLRAIPPHRFLVPAGGLAAAAIVITTAAVAISTGAGDEPETHFADAGPSPKAERLSTERQLKPFSRALKDSTPKASSAGGVGSSSASADSEAQVESATSFNGSLRSASKSGPFVAGARHRDIERSSQIVLGADPSEVRSDAAKVFETVHAYDGIVLRSSIGDGAEGDAAATFDLLIPSGKLGDALAAFSGIAEVRSRHEASQDITAPTVHTGERLQDSRAKIDGLLLQLAQADSDAERDAVEAQLRAERRHAAVLRSSLTSLQRRANLSHVSLRIETGEASATGTDDGGSWSIDDALGDAGRILAIAAGVTLVGLAIVGPLALIGLLAWLAYRASVRRRREQALR